MWARDVPLVEGAGFEPAKLVRATVLQTVAINHSAIPPRPRAPCTAAGCRVASTPGHYIRPEKCRQTQPLGPKTRAWVTSPRPRAHRPERILPGGVGDTSPRPRGPSPDGTLDAVQYISLAFRRAVVCCPARQYLAIWLFHSRHAHFQHIPTPENEPGTPARPDDRADSGTDEEDNH